MKEFSDKMVRVMRLPHGCYFALEKKGRRGERTYFRSDKLIRRKPYKGVEHPKGDDQRVQDVLNRIRAMIHPEIGGQVRAFGPDGTRITVQTLGRWRAMTPRPTDAQREARERTREERDQIRMSFGRWLDNEEDAVDDPETKFPHAVLAGLVDRFGDRTVREAFRSPSL